MRCDYDTTELFMTWHASDVSECLAQCTADAACFLVTFDHNKTAPNCLLFSTCSVFLTDVSSAASYSKVVYSGKRLVIIMFSMRLVHFDIYWEF